VTAPALDLYEIAYLAGGEPRLVDTALVALVETGRIRVDSPGQLAVAEPSRRHSIEAAVLDAVGTKGHRSVDMIRWRLVGDERILAVDRRLTAARLVRRWSRRLRGGDRPPLRTAAGRRALRADGFSLGPALDGSSALLVARHGREGMTDAQLRASIFEPPAPAVVDPGSRRSRRELAHSDPQAAALRNRGIVTGGAAVVLDAGFDGGGL